MVELNKKKRKLDSQLNDLQIKNDDLKRQVETREELMELKNKNENNALDIVENH